VGGSGIIRPILDQGVNKCLIYIWTRLCVSALRDVMEGGFADLLDTFISDSENVAAIASRRAMS
jgi:hypothetical protein